MATATLLSIQIGTTKTYTDKQGTWKTSFFKEAVSGPKFVELSGVVGDSQTNKVHHGGPEKAVLMYSADHYPAWQAELEQEFVFGGFAENLTVSNLDENSVFIGDIFNIGTMRLQVTQARQPCAKIARRWGIPDLTKQVLKTGRTGWYCRVLQTGTVTAGDGVELIERVNPSWTVARALETYTHWKENVSALQELATLPGLSSDWLEEINARLA
jgi:MOSC domain-containing protein YiiM